MSEQSTVKTKETVALRERGKKENEVFVQPRYKASKLDGVEAYEVAVLVPGVNKKGLEVSAENGELTIIARRGAWIPETWRPVYGSAPVERPADYRLVLSLNVDIDNERISAKLEDGILTLRLPVAEACKARLIAVQ
ncbi:MAG: Hsp20/alpha crystallin family protein [Verrucomicrobiota bacterium]